MLVGELDYALPPELIAQRPLDPRDASRMLLLERAAGSWRDCVFRELPELIRGDELIVLNNARVFPARLMGCRTGVRAQKPGRNAIARREFLSSPIEVLLLREVGPSLWEVLVRPGRKIRTGERIRFGAGELQAEVVGREEYGVRRLAFESRGDFAEAVQRLGTAPLPPYIRRDADTMDHERYQTVYAREPGAAAAPTAGLHFTREVLERLRARGAEICEITLRVGLGTFAPIRGEKLEQHRMHREEYDIPEESAIRIERAALEERPVLAVGTTVVRALEDAAEKCCSRQDKTGRGSRSGLVQAGRAEAEIFLYPGKPFRVTRQMLTNFHLPRSSLLALVTAFAGVGLTLRAYRHAIEQRYRFYSYGDCMLIR